MPRSYESNKPPGGWPPQGQGSGMGRKPSAENCANQSKFLKDRWKDPAFRDMMMVARKAGKEKRLGATL